MITCSQDNLTFEFSQIAVELQHCGEAYIAEWLPKIIAPEPKDIGYGIIDKSTWLPSSDRRSARQTAETITRDAVAEKFQAMVLGSVNRTFPRVSISFQRTLRLPDDGKTYPLPPGLGPFPLRPVTQYASRVPEFWNQVGGLMMPMYQAEALWMDFSTCYAFALKVGTGLVNAANGKPWSSGLSRDPQNYLVLPEQPWLDGYCVAAGTIRQFVAAPLGRGYTAEEQLNGSTRGGIQLEVIPLKAHRFFTKQLRDTLPRTAETVIEAILFSYPDDHSSLQFCLQDAAPVAAMGLGAGGKMKQEIYADQWEADDWDVTSPLRVWIHLCHALHWHQVTGELPPHQPVSAKDYTQAGLPWFDYYRDDMDVIDATPELAKLKTIWQASQAAGDNSLETAESFDIAAVRPLGPHAPAQAVTGWSGEI